MRNTLAIKKIALILFFLLLGTGFVFYYQKNNSPSKALTAPVHGACVFWKNAISSSIPFITSTPTPFLSPTTTLQASCFTQAGPLVTLSYNQINRYDTRNSTLAQNSKIDARTATWTAQWPVQDSFNYPVILSGGSNICFNGGIINGSYPVQISTDANATWEYMHGTTAILVNTKNTTFENTRINNYGDGIGIKYGAENFLLNKVHLSDIRDDCLENDWLYSGTVIDSLFDGCYSGFSARTYSSQSPFPADSS